MTRIRYERISLIVVRATRTGNNKNRKQQEHETTTRTCLDDRNDRRIENEKKPTHKISPNAPFPLSANSP